MFPMPKGDRYSMVNVILRKLRPPASADSYSTAAPLDTSEFPVLNSPDTPEREEESLDNVRSPDLHGLGNSHEAIPKVAINQQTLSRIDRDIQTNEVKLHNQTTQTDTPSREHPVSNSPSVIAYQTGDHDRSSQQQLSEANDQASVRSTLSGSDSLEYYAASLISDSQDTGTQALTERQTTSPRTEIVLDDTLPMAILQRNATRHSKPKKPFDEALERFLNENFVRNPGPPSPSLSPSPPTSEYDHHPAIDYSSLSEHEVIQQLSAIKISWESKNPLLRRQAIKDLRSLSMILVGGQYESLLLNEFNSADDEIRHVIEDVLQIFER
ncbi:hypothetical protein K493DRAFT_340638 [Basidiobolus meristosporus CBS 931.73]|uniref:Uncharacterized protein n=1 Tax=Basidiobolus meristosporus CBS 931.73 TaxID=1314790 RepID=A0A1Y1XVW4_9FUNG|nr:hypothetical protein K493DRAFT_340638 [Basidiobolus meristosporus CBS 931.73]|eukprot:ORX89434.1 hypothetical protein K493DRAFT_340638 [Basidiobolus meristosporus CBS 931.73]